MTNKLSNWLTRNAKGWLILFMLGLFFLFNLVIMPSGQEWLGGTTDEVGSIDLIFGAPAELLFEKVDAYGEHGHAVYRIFALTADLAYPIVYSIFFGLAITYFFRRAFPTRSWYQRLNLVPFAAAFSTSSKTWGSPACSRHTRSRSPGWRI